MCVVGKNNTTQSFIHCHKDRTKLTINTNKYILVFKNLLSFCDLIIEGKYVKICKNLLVTQNHKRKLRSPETPESNFKLKM